MEFPIKNKGGIKMRACNWVKFLVLTVLVFVIVLCIMNCGKILEAIIAFPLDWVISFIIGAGTMFLANSKFFRNKDDRSDR